MALCCPHSQVLQQGQQAAEQEVQARAVRAMLALTPPGLGEAVVGTAAAIVAEVAAAACAQRLLSQVCALVLAPQPPALPPCACRLILPGWGHKTLQLQQNRPVHHAGSGELWNSAARMLEA